MSISEQCINVFVTHYARAGDTMLNDATCDCIEEIERVSDSAHTLTVVGWAGDDCNMDGLGM